MTDRPRSESLELPVLPLRDVVVFPHMVIPLFVGRDKSIRALDIAMEGDKRILLVAQRSAETDDPEAADLYEVGTLAQVLQLLKLQLQRQICVVKKRNFNLCGYNSI